MDSLYHQHFIDLGLRLPFEYLVQEGRASHTEAIAYGYGWVKRVARSLNYEYITYGMDVAALNSAISPHIEKADYRRRAAIEKGETGLQRSLEQVMGSLRHLLQTGAEAIEAHKAGPLAKYTRENRI